MMDKAQLISKTQHRLSELLDKQISYREIVFFIVAALCFSSFISPPIALLLGLVVARITGHPYLHLNHKITHILLQVSVVGLGFGMNANTALQVGKEGFLFTVGSILFTLTLGWLLCKALKIDLKTSFLISAGTAICGGSAIAAVSPVIGAKEKQISVALGTVFILNSVALFVFPLVGEWLHLSQNQFGLWSAIAIHDTSSVVGAAAKYGKEALQIATTVKLARALWIIPLAVIASFVFKTQKVKVKIPYFIGLFVVAMLLNTYIPQVQYVNGFIVNLSKIGLTLTLFLIGSGLTGNVLKSVGLKPMLQGVILWVSISIFTLWVILSFYS
ncbi:putative sulfate exporter family transporter (plasmid) [Chondrinema litorale]|nr:putative sulfate exporter family transporter [Chondrinema litorale]UZR98342.1 putative sulfate exporter family transporter [Chondrinema litorale]